MAALNMHMHEAPFSSRDMGDELSVRVKKTQMAKWDMTRRKRGQEAGEKERNRLEITYN